MLVTSTALNISSQIAGYINLLPSLLKLPNLPDIYLLVRELTSLTPVLLALVS